MQGVNIRVHETEITQTIIREITAVHDDFEVAGL
jgi:hypothetical protein